MLLRTFRIAVLVAAGLAASTGARAQPINVNAFVQQWDADLDGVKKAAVAQFETLDRKHTGALTRSQLAGLVSYQQLLVRWLIFGRPGDWDALGKTTGAISCWSKPRRTFWKSVPPPHKPVI